MNLNQEKAFVAKAIDRLKDAGYTLKNARDGVTQCIFMENTPTKSAVERISGTDLAWFDLDSQNHSCTLFITWGEGEECINDISSDSFEELEKIEKIIGT